MKTIKFVTRNECEFQTKKKPNSEQLCFFQIVYENDICFTKQFI